MLATIYNTLHRISQIEQQKLHKRASDAPEGFIDLVILVTADSLLGFVSYADVTTSNLS